MITKLSLKDDTCNPCFIKNIRLKISIFQLHKLYYSYYLIGVRQYFAIAIILADQNHVITVECDISNYCPNPI